MAYITTTGKIIHTTSRKSYVGTSGRLYPIRGDNESDEEFSGRKERERSRQEKRDREE